MKGTSYLYLSRGIGEVLLAALCLVMLVGGLFGGAGVIPVGACVVGFFGLLTDGLICVGRSRKIAAFR